MRFIYKLNRKYIHEITILISKILYLITLFISQNAIVIVTVPLITIAKKVNVLANQT